MTLVTLVTLNPVLVLKEKRMDKNYRSKHKHCLTEAMSPKSPTSPEWRFMR
jgi:hypothetical protein